MQIIKKKINKTEIKLSLHEISALTQVFNYARGAAKIDNFEQLIGITKEKHLVNIIFCCLVNQLSLRRVDKRAGVNPYANYEAFGK